MGCECICLHKQLCCHSSGVAYVDGQPGQELLQPSQHKSMLFADLRLLTYRKIFPIFFWFVLKRKQDISSEVLYFYSVQHIYRSCFVICRSRYSRWYQPCHRALTKTDNSYQFSSVFLSILLIYCKNESKHQSYLNEKCSKSFLWRRRDPQKSVSGKYAITHSYNGQWLYFKSSILLSSANQKQRSVWKGW